MSEQVLCFGPFELFSTRRRLLRAGEPVRLGSRALDILVALVARAGEVVGKEELIAAIWPNTFVEENNLRVHMTALRKALGDDHAAARYIVNIPGRGYSFVAVINGVSATVLEPSQRPPRRPIDTLPVSLGGIIGREDVVLALAAEVAERRLLTITGTGGIGKTTVAVAVADRLRPEYPDGVAYLDLAPISDPRFLPNLLASALGQPKRFDDPLHELALLLRDLHLLVVLDSCEHLIEAAAHLAETLLRQAPRLHILATSREPLRAEGEKVYRLASLEVPPQGGAARAKDILPFPAVQLFVRGAFAGLGGYELSDSDAPFVVEICRRLDGIALAIELAAARVETIGIAALAGALDDAFRVLTRGRRTALPRHQTLRATLDWSYRLLSPREQLLLRRLAVFNGAFGIEAVRAVATGGGLSEREIDDGLAGLADKSLVTTDGGHELRFRLLETTRAYAHEKLEQGGEHGIVSRHHAEHYSALFRRAESEWETRPSIEWLADYERHIGNLRAALAWAFASSGDPSVGVDLTVAAVPLWFQLSLVDECLERVKRALPWTTGDRLHDKRRRMQLHAALGWPQMRAVMGVLSGAEAWEATLALAEDLGDADYELRALWALWVDCENRGETRAALALADRFTAIADLAGAPADRSMADRMRGRTLNFLGDQDGALRNIRQMLDRYVAPRNRSHTARFQYDQTILARITLARSLWLKGLPDQALRETERNIDEALALGHVLTLSNALSDGACPVALLAGDMVLADRYTAMLHRYTRDHALDVWHTYADAFRGQILIRTGDLTRGTDTLRTALDKLEGSGFVLFRTQFLAALAEALATEGRRGEALSVVDRALGLCAATGEGWFLPELHRLKGEMILEAGEAGSESAAVVQFEQAMGLAREQGALPWEIRAATSLAWLRLAQGRPQDAADLLVPVRERFTEGFETPDLVAADAVLTTAREAVRL